VAVGLAGARPAGAAVELSDLLVPGASLISGPNLVFDQFTFSSTGDMPSAGGLLVQEFQDASGNYGIRLTGGMADLAGGNASTIELNYRVSVVDGGGLVAGISSVLLQGNPTAIGQGSLKITENFNGIPTTLSIFDIAPAGPGNTKLLDSSLLPSMVSSLNVKLSVEGKAKEGAATASIIDQTFTTEDAIPEPSSLAIWFVTLTLFGAVPAAYRRWSK
jgi:hypothetical protein